MAAMPYGKYPTFLGNMVTECRAMANLVITQHALGVMFGSMVLYLLIFAALRTSAGFIAMKHVHFEVSLNNIGWAFYFYMVDVFCPIHYVFGLMVGTEKNFGRRGWYCLLVGILTVFEAFNASEFVLARVLLCLLDRYVFKTGNGQISRMLDLDVQGIAGRFPVQGAISFCSLEGLTNVSRFVVSVTSQTRIEGQAFLKRGVGLLVSDIRGMTNLISVKHVVDGADLLHIEMPDGTIHECNPSERKVVTYCGVDPVVSVNMSGSVVGVHGISHLTASERNSVSAMVMVTGVDAIGFITDFEITSYADVQCNINLMSGDSGTPVIAVLKTGEYRLVGCVSRGTFDTGAKNLISSVINGPYQGDPGSLNAYYDVSSVVDATKGKALAKIHNMMLENAKHVCADKELEDTSAAEEAVDESESQALIETRRKHHEEGEDAPEEDDAKAQGQGQSKDKKRNKSSRKNAAMKKRLAEFELLTSVALDGMDAVLCEELTRKFKMGDIVDFNKDRRFHNVYEQTKSVPRGKTVSFVRSGIGFTGT